MASIVLETTAEPALSDNLRLLAEVSDGQGPCGEGLHTVSQHCHDAVVASETRDLPPADPKGDHFSSVISVNR